MSKQMGDVNEAVGKTRQLYELLKAEYYANEAHDRERTPETHAAWDAARDAALQLIDTDQVAKGLFLFGLRLGKALVNDVIHIERPGAN